VPAAAKQFISLVYFLSGDAPTAYAVINQEVVIPNDGKYLIAFCSDARALGNQAAASGCFTVWAWLEGRISILVNSTKFIELTRSEVGKAG
jgi:hypothetical protein